jgi:uncharacterized protein YprB with RNaseH-like and TPR domain
VAIHAAALADSRQTAARGSTPSGDLPPIDRVLRGEWHDTADGPVFVRDEWFPLDHQHGALTLSSALSAPPDVIGMLETAGRGPAAERIAFFDIETTGLSGGTGTYVVLAGLGSYERAAAGEPLAFRLRQYFLAGLAHERAMLALLADDLGRFEGIVTYNGRAFDIPFVETRLTLARLPSPCGALAHVDLLHAVRRLYRHRMPGCRLAEAERRLLRMDRPDDLPGWLIPSLYFDYIKAGRAAPLRGVFRHNADDVLSLVGVLARVSALFTARELPPEDAAALGRWWERTGDERRALELYREALPWLEGGEDWAWAASRTAMLLRRAGERADAGALWGRIWKIAGSDAAGLEFAKYLEHDERLFEAAREIVRALHARCGDGTKREALQHRLNRLSKKLGDV